MRLLPILFSLIGAGAANDYVRADGRTCRKVTSTELYPCRATVTVTQGCNAGSNGACGSPISTVPACKDHPATIIVQGCSAYTTLTREHSGADAITGPTTVQTISPANCNAMGTYIVETPAAASDSTADTESTAGPESSAAPETTPESTAPETTVEGPTPESTAPESTAPESTPESTTAAPTSTEEDSTSSASASTAEPTDENVPLTTFGECALWRIQKNPMNESTNTLYTIDLVTGKEMVLADDVRSNVRPFVDEFNGLSYQPANKFLWAISTGEEGRHLAVIGSNGVVSVYADTMPIDADVGDIDDKGDMWIYDSKTGDWAVYDTDFSADTFKMVKSDGTTDKPDYTPHDWSYVGMAGDNMWSLGENGDSAALMKFDRTTHEWTIVQDVGDLSGSNKFGSTWGFNDGYLWASEDDTGDIYRCTVADDKEKSCQKVSTGITAPVYSDGAHCPDGPSPEIN